MFTISLLVILLKIEFSRIWMVIFAKNNCDNQSETSLQKKSKISFLSLAHF
jgi:hypothetical protein